MKMILGVMVLTAALAAGETEYWHGEDSERQDGVPAGKVTKHVFRSAGVYPGTAREYYVYVPAQYDGREAAALMVFQDGHTYVRDGGDFRVPVVFDNLIAKGEMPVTVAVMVNPGWFVDGFEKEQGWKTPEGVRSNRSVEYDTLSDAYVRFLETELLPEVGKSVKLSEDPAKRAICGISSGGICAWTAAWERPDLFGKVMSHIGSFTNIRGGHVYPALIRKTERKPIRVFLQDGSGDLDNAHGNWPLANQQMAKSLAYAGYDYEFVYGDGAHNGKHGGAILPDSLRWLWRKE